MKIVVASGRGYEIAAQEFQKYYRQITGKTLEIVVANGDKPQEKSFVLIGASFVNSLSLALELDGVIPAVNVKAGSDEYAVKSVAVEDGKILYMLQYWNLSICILYMCEVACIWQSMYKIIYFYYPAPG